MKQLYQAYSFIFNLQILKHFVKGLLRINPKERTDLRDVRRELTIIISEMPANCVLLAIEGTNEYPKAIDFTTVMGTGF